MLLLFRCKFYFPVVIFTFSLSVLLSGSQFSVVSFTFPLSVSLFRCQFTFRPSIFRCQFYFTVVSLTLPFYFTVATGFVKRNPLFSQSRTNRKLILIGSEHRWHFRGSSVDIYYIAATLNWSWGDPVCLTRLYRPFTTELCNVTSRNATSVWRNVTRQCRLVDNNYSPDGIKRINEFSRRCRLFSAVSNVSFLKIKWSAI